MKRRDGSAVSLIWRFSIDETVEPSPCFILMKRQNRPPVSEQINEIGREDVKISSHRFFRLTAVGSVSEQHLGFLEIRE